MPVRVSCPLCNAASVLPHAPADRRAVCPRCGETFPVTAVEEVSNAASLNGTPAAVPTRRGQRAFRGRVSVLRAVVLMMAMGLVGVGVGMAVLASRGGFAARPTTAADPPAGVAVVPPADLSGLRSLFPGTNLVAAVQPAPALAYAARHGTDARELLAKAGVPTAVFATLDKAGVTLPQIDHVAAGLVLGDDRAELKLSAALVLRRPPDDEDRLLQALDARRFTRDGRTYYHVAVGGLPLVLARPNPRLAVFATDENALHALVTGDGANGGLSKEFADTIRTRLGPEAAAWAAAADADWANKPGVKLAVGTLLKKPDVLVRLGQGRAAVVGLSFDDPPRLRAFVRAADGPTGDRLRDWFRERVPGDAARAGGAGEWAFADAPFDPAGGTDWPRRLVEGK